MEARQTATPTLKRFGWVALVLALLLGAGISGVVVRWLSTASSASESAESKQTFHCPMHPNIVMDHAGNCPICGMKLVLVEPATSTAGAQSPGHSNNTKPSADSPVANMAAVEIDPSKQQLIGLTTAEVTKGNIGGQVRTVGRVTVDETRVRHVNIKNGGFVERIFVDFVGKHVRRGEPLFTLFSPELLAAQEEYLLAKRTQESLNVPQGSSNATLLAAAKRRLALWDVSDKELQKLEATGIPAKTITFYSPASGVVTKKDVVDGMKLEAGSMPYEIVDLSNVWVLADVYESELRFVKNGTPAAMTMKAFPGRTFEGKVAFIDPFLSPQSRTVKVRLTFPNPNGDLRPEMFGEVVLQLGSREALMVPVDAVIDSGTAKVVFIAQDDGKFTPRTIELGQSNGDFVEVLKGLTLGERVVTRANFLLDSESRLRFSLSELGGAKKESARVLPPSGTETSAGSNSQAPVSPPHTGHGR